MVLDGGHVPASDLAEAMTSAIRGVTRGMSAPPLELPSMGPGASGSAGPEDVEAPLEVPKAPAPRALAARRAPPVQLSGRRDSSGGTMR